MASDNHKRVISVSRVYDNARAISLFLSEVPSDDDLRSLHEFLRAWNRRVAPGDDGIDRVLVLLRGDPALAEVVAEALLVDSLQAGDPQIVAGDKIAIAYREGWLQDIRLKAPCALAAIANYIEQHARSAPEQEYDLLKTVAELPYQELIDRAAKAEAEVERLNTWADGFSDAQLKERRLCEELLREREGEIKELTGALERLARIIAAAEKEAREVTIQECAEIARKLQYTNALEQEDIAASILSLLG